MARSPDRGRTDARLTTQDEETGDMVVVTIVVPRTAREDLAVSIREHEVTISGSGDYRHEVALPPEADADRVRAQLYDEFLELRAPRTVVPRGRPVPMRVIR